MQVLAAGSSKLHEERANTKGGQHGPVAPRYIHRIPPHMLRSTFTVQSYQACPRIEGGQVQSGTKIMTVLCRPSQISSKILLLLFYDYTIVHFCTNKQWK